jgi:hypothetical protein
MKNLLALALFIAVPFVVAMPYFPTKEVQGKRIVCSWNSIKYF